MVVLNLNFNCIFNFIPFFIDYNATNFIIIKVNNNYIINFIRTVNYYFNYFHHNKINSNLLQNFGFGNQTTIIIIADFANYISLEFHLKFMTFTEMIDRL